MVGGSKRFIFEVQNAETEHSNKKNAVKKQRNSAKSHKAPNPVIFSGILSVSVTFQTQTAVNLLAHTYRLFP
jgi:hypothetical protein